MTTPAMNPTGSNFLPIASGNPPMAGTFALPGASTGRAGGTGGPGNYGYGNSTNPNPPGFGPTTSMTPGATPGASTAFNPGTPQNYSKDLLSKLNDTFGSGMGALINDFLTKSQGGYNSALTQQSVDAQIANMQHQEQVGYGKLQTELGQQGISPESSVAALESSNFQAQATAQENAITAQEFYNMWNQSQQREFGLLGEVAGATHQHQGNAGDWANQFSAVAGGISSLAGGGVADFVL